MLGFRDEAANHMQGGTTTILVADANPTNSKVMERRLRHMGHRVFLRKRGSDIIERALSGDVDLLLIDRKLPDLSGIKVVRELRRYCRCADLPVIMITARSDSGAAVEALAAGADDHVAKPFDFTVLEAKINRMLDNAARLAEIKQTNAALDARATARAVELDEIRAALEANKADRARLVASIQALNAEIEQLSIEAPAPASIFAMPSRPRPLPAF